MRELTEREKSVLTAVIEVYTETAEPVGSRTISRQHLQDVSAATIRNTMLDLEEIGLIAQPHTSAGREPTAQGYRYYLNNLMRPSKLSTSDRAALDHLLDERTAARNEDNVLLHVAKAIANLSHMIGVAFLPSFDRGVLEKIDLMPISDSRVLAIIQIRGGPVDTVTLELPEPVKRELIEETTQALNERLSGMPIGQIRRTIGERLRGLSRGDRDVIDVFVHEGAGIFDMDSRSGLMLEGRPHLLEQPEFTDRARLTELLETLDNRFLIGELRRDGAPAKVDVTIGDENDISALATCSLLTRTYSVGDLSGTLAIVGPMRMPYGRLLAALEHASTVTEELLG
jgi:heat-inducible transcriptional repressor